MEAEHLPLSSGSRQSTGTAVGGRPAGSSLAIHSIRCGDASRHHLQTDSEETETGAVLTFPRAAVLHAGGEVLEAVGVALAAAVAEGLALHGGHVEEEALEQGPTGSLLFGEPADLGDFCGDCN